MQSPQKIHYTKLYISPSVKSIETENLQIKYRKIFGFFWFIRSNIEQELDNVAVSDNVILTLASKESFFFCGIHRAACHEIVK